MRSSSPASSSVPGTITPGIPSNSTLMLPSRASFLHDDVSLHSALGKLRRKTVTGACAEEVSAAERGVNSSRIGVPDALYFSVAFACLPSAVMVMRAMPDLSGPAGFLGTVNMRMNLEQSEYMHEDGASDVSCVGVMRSEMLVLGMISRSDRLLSVVAGFRNMMVVVMVEVSLERTTSGNILVISGSGALVMVTLNVAAACCSQSLLMSA